MLMSVEYDILMALDNKTIIDTIRKRAQTLTNCLL